MEYLDHISTGCRLKSKFPSWWQKNSKLKVTMFFLDIFFCRQCVKKYDNIVEGDQNKSDVENESDNDYSCETPRNKFNTSPDTMVIFPVHFHGVVQHSRTWTAKYKLDRAVEHHYQMLMLWVLINLLALNLLMLFLKLNKRAWLFTQFDKREVGYHYILWKDINFDTFTRFLAPSILCRTF